MPFESSKDLVASATIKLTDREAQLRNLLLDVARYIDESKEIKETLELRFAGGWVRDKLLNIPSHDIDTAISAMTGYHFALRLKEYLLHSGNMEKHGLQREDVGNLHKIAANPEKSKHLETVTTKILGFDVDFVNLRKETYSADSRNPQMEFGTAKEDAIRRDATVNALFYNLHTDEVEDFAGGLADLDAKLIQTPLEPYQTFVDDPLRVLRLVRFASRLNFKIASECEKAMEDPRILEALKVKISRERVGVEVEKMLKGNNPHLSLHLIDSLGLYSTIFTDPTAAAMPAVSTANWQAAYDCLSSLISNESPESVYKLLVRSEEANDLTWFLAALAPWAILGSPAITKIGGKQPFPYATLVAREGIKANNRLCDVVTGAARHIEDISKFKDEVLGGKSFEHERDILGMKIREWETNGGHWRVQVVLAIMIEAMKTDVSSGYGSLFGGWQKFLDHVVDIDLLEAASCKRLIDGTQLAKALDARPGRWMATALDVCMAWQFRNPGVTDLDGAIKEVRARARELEIPIQ